MTTRLTPEQIQLMKDELTTELVGYLLDDYHYTPEEAIDVVYTSETFERLQDDATGLCRTMLLVFTTRVLVTCTLS